VTVSPAPCTSRRRGVASSTWSRLKPQGWRVGESRTPPGRLDLDQPQSCITRHSRAKNEKRAAAITSVREDDPRGSTARPTSRSSRPSARGNGDFGREGTVRPLPDEIGLFLATAAERSKTTGRSAGIGPDVNGDWSASQRRNAQTVRSEWRRTRHVLDRGRARVLGLGARRAPRHLTAQHGLGVATLYALQSPLTSGPIQPDPASRLDLLGGRSQKPNDLILEAADRVPSRSTSPLPRAGRAAGSARRPRG